MLKAKNDYLEQQQEFFEKFRVFRKLEHNIFKKLCSTTKERIFQKDEFVTLDGCKAD